MSLVGCSYRMSVLRCLGHKRQTGALIKIQSISWDLSIVLPTGSKGQGPIRSPLWPIVGASVIIKILWSHVVNLAVVSDTSDVGCPSGITFWLVSSPVLLCWVDMGHGLNSCLVSVVMSWACMN